MRVETNEACPLPDDSLLAEVASALEGAGHWAHVVDASWRVVYMPDEVRLSFGGSMELVPVELGVHLFGSVEIALRLAQRFGPNSPEAVREWFSGVGGMVLADTAGGQHELRSLVDPALVDLVDELAPADGAVGSWSTLGGGVGGRFEVRHTALRIRDAAGTLRGTALFDKPAAGMSVLATMAFQREAQHLARTQRVASAGGLPGRHVGDGVVAFFPAETFASESAAARACITAAHSLRAAMDDVASRSDLTADDVVMRFGLHWGSTLYMGHITTVARTEVTALGDEVNEAARIEACATGGRVLASKPLIERLDFADATAIGLDPDHTTYTQLADLTTATDKARRDAPAIAVCEL